MEPVHPAAPKAHRVARRCAVRAKAEAGGDVFALAVGGRSTDDGKTSRSVSVPIFGKARAERRKRKQTVKMQKGQTLVSYT
jgi:hypothetical protein